MNWLDENYETILQWAANITKNDELAHDLAHYSIEQLLTHKRYEEILERHNQEPTKGHLRGFLLAIMRNSWVGNKSEFTRYYKLHRSDIGHRKGTVTEDYFQNVNLYHEEYDFEEDFILEAITGILEELELDIDELGWFHARLFKMWLEDSNFSSLARKTGIPRTSIANAVNAAREHIQQELKNRNINYDPFDN